MSLYRGAGGASDATDDSTVNAVAGYASSAASSASSASTSAANASNSATAAASSAAGAAISASSVSTDATNAASSASLASTYAASANNSKDNAAASATIASTKAGEASTFASNASTSASNALTSANNAAASSATASTIVGSGNGIFGTTPISTSGTVTLNGGTANGVPYLNGSKVLTSGSVLTFDGTNLGLGVTPSAWAGTGGIGALDSYSWSLSTDGAANISTYGVNTYFDGTNWVYKRGASATKYTQYTGSHRWHTAPSGQPGAAITFTQAMTLDTSGILLVGLTSATGAAKFQVSGPLQTTGYTVATLPAGTVGMRTYVTNALAPTFGSAVVGGGSVTIPVFYNGSTWIVA